MKVRQAPHRCTHRRQRRALDAIELGSARREPRPGHTRHPFPDHALGGGWHGTFERLGHLARRREALFPAACERLGDDGVERLGRARDELARHLDFVLQEGGQETCDVAVLRWVDESAPDEPLPEHDPDRIDVGAPVDHSRRELLGRHVPELALDLAVLGRPVHTERRLRDAEIEHASDAVQAEKDVLRRHVTVDDVEGVAVLAASLVRSLESVQYADDDRHERALRQGNRLLAREAQQRVQRLAVDVVHDEEQLALGGDHVEHRHDVRVLDARREASLVEEHRDELRVARELRVEALDRHRPREPGRASEPAQMDGRHPAMRDLLEENITPDRSGLMLLLCEAHRPSAYSRSTPGAAGAHWIG